MRDASWPGSCPETRPEASRFTLTDVSRPEPHPLICVRDRVLAGLSSYEDRCLRFRDALIGAGLLIPTGVMGIFGRSATYEDVASGVVGAVSRLGQGRFEAVHFPPLLTRSTFDRTQYMQSFPDLMGSVHIFRGTESSHRELIRRYETGGDWTEILQPADVVLSSAACHALYPLCTGRLPAGGRRLEILGHCFRAEPSTDPMRMQSFRMHELVYVGTPAGARQHRDDGLAAGLSLLRELGLDMDAVPASDPFFGRAGTMLTHLQLEGALKIEATTPVVSDDRPSAIMSANYAQDYFGREFDITTHDGGSAHSSCVAFGVDRITLALFNRHGFDPDAWPRDTRDLLWPRIG